MTIESSSLRMQKVKEELVKGLLLFFTLISVATTVGIILVLSLETYHFFQHIPLSEFFGSLEWAPLLDPRHFGIWPLICGTVLVAAIAAIFAIPLGVGTAIYLGEYASMRTRAVIKPLVELLAGIPTVVYGYFGVTVVTPFLTRLFPDTEVFNAASAGIVVAIMILPMIASLCDDALRAVPDTMRDAGYALGATKLEVSVQVILPAAISGILASFILAISRAFGETMAVSLAAGSTPKLTLNPLESIQTMTAYIVQVSLGDTPHGTIEYQSIFVVGMMLFVITCIMNLLADWIIRRYRAKYE